MTAAHQKELIARQLKGGGQSKAITLTASMWKGGGNNGVTYIIEVYEHEK